ncbi:Ureohydrolase [Nadsonia fulvescens var. elongata DSM 6958]|uniref:Arginase n=1 Tax=Nadsonia fulvescens var. elongata DSM 6958 TaxID=857566 RepID=A0A1E3PE58_9ASCO|nr:Ureohydrolase [Nadsonia fulvescens var. elongata DSM 6958]
MHKFYPKKELTLISAPFSGGQGRDGVDEGPRHLLEMGLVNEIEELGWKTHFDGHLDFPIPAEDADIGKMKRPRYVSNSNKIVYEAVSKAVKNDTFPLTIGGDHSIAIGTVAGVQSVYPNAGVLWIDAHADINTPESTDSGNLHGCPVSFLVGLAKAQPGQEDVFGWVNDCLSFDRLAYIALRDLDVFEKKIIKEKNIIAYTMHHVDKYGIAKVVEMALNRLDPDGDRPIHLSFDVDAIDPIYAPSTGTPVRGGLTWREASYLCEAVAETGNLVAMDIVECNPHLGETEIAVKDTIAVGITLAKCALGDVLL